MELTDSDVATNRTPVWHWIVAGLAFLWNCIGPIDYVMTRTRNEAYLKSMMPGVDPQAIYNYIDAMPIWSQVGWALGVWGGFVGGALLLLRSRHAVTAFAVSLVGVALSLGWELITKPPMPMDPGMMPYVIIAIAVALLFYARAMKARGVLR